jgi:hypothetical protein
MAKGALEPAGIDAIIQADSAGGRKCSAGPRALCGDLRPFLGTRGFLLAIERDVLEPPAKQA